MLHYVQNDILEVGVGRKAQMRFVGYVEADRATGMSEEGLRGCRHSFGSRTGRTNNFGKIYYMYQTIIGSTLKNSFLFSLHLLASLPFRVGMQSYLQVAISSLKPSTLNFLQVNVLWSTLDLITA